MAIMVFSAPTETKTLIKALPEFTQDVYANISSAELVVFVVQALHTDEPYVRVEEIVSACFRLFPHRFSLKNYFYWPDSALVLSSLNEAKEKGDLKDKIGDGFAVKVQGRQTVKQVAKALGVTLPRPEKKIKKPVALVPAPEPKKVEPPKAKKTKKKAEVKKPIATVVKKKAVVKKTIKPTVKAEAKKKLPEKAVAMVKKVSPKVKPKPKQKEKLPTPVLEKAAPTQKKVKPKRVTKSPQPKQLTLIPHVPAEAKKTVKGPAARPQIKKETKVLKSQKFQAAQPVKKAEKVPAVAIIVSKEEKAKAGKVLHMLERSDAYRQYKRLDGKAKISEFDFRNMLFATMESSAETLKRNVELFKRYAGIHSRMDLVTFLDFCEVNFAELLKPSVKKVGRKR